MFKCILILKIRVTFYNKFNLLTLVNYFYKNKNEQYVYRIY